MEDRNVPLTDFFNLFVWQETNNVFYVSMSNVFSYFTSLPFSKPVIKFCLNAADAYAGITIRSIWSTNLL